MTLPEPRTVPRTSVRGTALLLVLIVLGAASLWALQGLLMTTQDERIAARYRQSQWALSAAEMAAIQAGEWWSQSTTQALRNEQRFWNEPERALLHLNLAIALQDPRLEGQIIHLAFSDDIVVMTAQGRLLASGLERFVIVHYQRYGTENQEHLEEIPTDGQSNPKNGRLVAWYEPRHRGMPVP